MKEDERMVTFAIIAICGIVFVFLISLIIAYAPGMSISFSRNSVGQAAELAVKGGPMGKNTCTDTDGGKNYPLQGTVSGINNNKYYKITDKCIKMNNLQEYYCEPKGSESFVKSVYVNCPGTFGGKSTCLAGACTRVN
jgi:hypothetical protein